MTRNTFFAIISLACLISCTMAPEYKRPAAPIPSAWPSGPAYKEAADELTESTKSAPSDIKWREFYADERLQKVIETALSNNRDIKLAALNVERARAIYGIRRAELLPAINATGTWIEQRIPADISSESGEAMNYKQYEIMAGAASWEIDFFGRLRSLKDKVLEEYLATEQARNSAQIALIAAVANTYLALAADRENLKLAQSTLDAQQATYNLIKRRFDAGTSSMLDLRQAQTRLDAARVDVARYTNLVAQDENALNLLAGLPLHTDLLPVDFNVIAPFKNISPGLSSKILLSRPDILQAEHMLKASNANIGAARAAFFPRIALTSNYGTTSKDLSGLFKAGSNSWLFVPQIVMPIFDARLWPALKASKVEREIVLTQYEKTIQAAFREVADVLAVQGTIEKQLSAQESLVKATSDVYNIAETRYKKGIDSYFTVLDAQRSLYGARQGLTNIRLTHYANKVRLYAVLGGGSD
jgi:multidrug efflux system outer membrane protein